MKWNQAGMADATDVVKHCGYPYGSQAGMKWTHILLVAGLRPDSVNNT